MKYRLGLDLGSNSIGWCVLELGKDSGEAARDAPFRLIDAGVRILTPNEEAGRDPQSKTSLATQRRDARSARRRRDRFLRRQRRLMQVLVEAGLMPADSAARKELESLDPYWLRATALDEPLEPHELGRAIFHLNQRRGFRSNRIADSDDPEKSSMKAGMQALREALNARGVRTLGEFLNRRHKRDRYGRRLKNGDAVLSPEPVRFRPTAQGGKNLYDFYPSRDLVADELRRIWKAQAPHNGALTDELLARIERIVIEQRPLKQPPVGRCTLRPDVQCVEQFGTRIDLGERTPKAHPLFQRARILQDVAQLRVAKPGRPMRYLTMQEHKAIVAKLMSTGGNTVEFEKLRKAAKLPDDMRFNYELAGRKGFPPDQTAVKLAAGKAFGKGWRSFPRDRQIEVAERLLAVEDAGELIDWLCDSFDIDADTAETISELRLPQGHGRFGRSVLRDLVEVMETATREDAVDPETGEIFERAVSYDEAIRELGLHHSDLRPDGRLTRLPYYGSALMRHVISKPDAPEDSQERIGRVPNPTVHIALNQLRRIVNGLIEDYGPPTEIVLELGRELKLSRERKDELQRENRRNEQANEDRRERLAKLGVADTYEARLRLRLFDELPADERVCVYSGDSLSMERLFGGSSDIDIDHILPFSATLDDSFMNKVLCNRESNRRKGNRAPADVWSGDDLQEIVERAERLFPKKAWRFQPDAKQRFDEEGGFLARQLIDTQYMSRLAKTYLELVCDQVWAPPGRLTAMLRAKWGLNSLLPDHNYANVGQPKNRKDHRHHAIDAFVVACTDRGLLNRIAQASGRAEDLDIDRLFPKDGFPEPWDGFRDELAARFETMIVSHKPDHGIAPEAQDNVGVTSGKLHEATAYGPANDVIDGKPYNLVKREPIESLLTDDKVARVRDARLRERLQELLDSAKTVGGSLSDAERRELLAKFGRENGIRRVRLLVREQSARVVRHQNVAGQTFEKSFVPGDNHRIEVFALPDGTWSGEGIAVHDANQPGFRSTWRAANPEARFVMRLHKGDLIEADFGDGRNVYRVYQLEPSQKRVRVIAHNEGGSIDKRHKDPDDPLLRILATYEKMRAAGARPFRVNPLGREIRSDARAP